LSSVELASLVMTHNVLGVRHRCAPVESLSERFPDKRSRVRVMTARTGMGLA
jgi:hypothetical protein